MSSINVRIVNKSPVVANIISTSPISVKILRPISTASIDHGGLGGLLDDDHSPYYNYNRHTKSVHDDLGINAVTLGGKTASEFALSGQEAWIAPDLHNDWVNHGEGFSPAGYFKDSFGIVHLRGRVKSGIIGQAIFQLPAGYRPPYQEAYSVYSFDGENQVLARCDVDASGNVIAMAGGNSRFSLHGISFRTA